MAFYKCGGGGIDTSMVDATAEDVKSLKTIVDANGQPLVGTMKDNGAVSITLSAGGVYTIPAGYHNGGGKVSVKTLASQTSATATADKIEEGYTAYVNGEKLIGTSKPKKVTIDEKEITENLKLSTIYLFNTKYISSVEETLSGEQPILFSYDGNLYLTGHKVTETKTGAYLEDSADIPMKFRDSATEFGDNVFVREGSKVFTHAGSLYFMPFTRGNSRMYRWTGESWGYTGYSYGGFPVIYNHNIHLLNADGLVNGRWEQGLYHYVYNGRPYDLIGKMPYTSGFPVVYNNEIHLLGGSWGEYNEDGGAKCYNHYKYNGNSWTKVETLPFNFNKTNNDIYAFCYNNEIHALDDSSYHIYNGTSWGSPKYNDKYLGFNSANAHPGAPCNIPVVYNNKLYYYDYIPVYIEDSFEWKHALVIIEPIYIKQ